MLYESCGWSLRARKRLWLASGCSQALLPASPADPSGDPFARYIPRAFPLQGIFPDPWCARASPLMPKVGRKCCHSWLAGGIFSYGSKYGPRLVDSTEVTNMKRTP